MNHFCQFQKIILIFFINVIFVTVPVIGQAPQFVSYQAIVNDSGGNPVEGSIGIRVSILQGSDTGTQVYSERHRVNSDKNGLVSIRIGEGETIYLGKFDSIDWSDGPYYSKIDISPTGGFLYTISHTSQLLSVPFALHAYRADSVSGNFQERDPLFSASVAKNITIEDINEWNSLSKKALYNIGDIHDGGIIFYVDPSGQHGLITSLNDIADNVIWAPEKVSSGGNSSFNGLNNTANIVSYFGAGNYAAYLCDTLNLGGYKDWYLPSVDELRLLFNVRYVLNKALDSIDMYPAGVLLENRYWTSTERDDNNVYLFEFGNNKYGSKSDSGAIRAIRAF